MGQIPAAVRYGVCAAIGFGVGAGIRGGPARISATGSLSSRNDLSQVVVPPPRAERDAEVPELARMEVMPAPEVTDSHGTSATGSSDDVVIRTQSRAEWHGLERALALESMAACVHAFPTDARAANAAREVLFERVRQDQGDVALVELEDFISQGLIEPVDAGMIRGFTFRRLGRHAEARAAYDELLTDDVSDRLRAQIEVERALSVDSAYEAEIQIRRLRNSADRLTGAEDALAIAVRRQVEDRIDELTNKWGRS